MKLQLKNNFINNIKLFKSYKISVCSIIKYNKNIMFNSNIKLKELIHIYLLYGIKLDNECYNFEWLEKDLSNIIDKFIEINQYDLIKNNLSLLNTSSNMIVKRCILYMYLNNSVVNEQNKLRGSLRKEDNFIMSDDELNETIITNYDNYIPKDIIEVLNANDFINNNVYDINLDSLNDYLINPYTYKFNNILISKNKIIRNLNILLNKELDKVYSIKELLLYSIIYNYPNLLLSNTIELIKDIINKKVKKLTK